MNALRQRLLKISIPNSKTASVVLLIMSRTFLSKQEFYCHKTGLISTLGVIKTARKVRVPISSLSLVKNYINDGIKIWGTTPTLGPTPYGESASQTALEVCKYVCPNASMGNNHKHWENASEAG